MKRKFEFGCLVILTIIGLLINALLLLAQDCDTLPFTAGSVVYDPIKRVPVHVSYILDRSHLGRSERVSGWKFIEDTRVPAPRARHDDFKGCAMDRGHMIPASHRSASVQSMRETFLLTNVCGQKPSLNRGAWKRVEDGCRRWAESGRTLRVEIDPVFWYAPIWRIGRDSVCVPHGFVKTIYLLPQDSMIYARYFQNY